MVPARQLSEGLRRAREQPLYKDFLAVDFTISPEVRRAEKLIAEHHIEDHEFFELASENKRAVKAWVGQELTVTNSFSQRLLEVAALFSNVFIREHLLELIVGEHSMIDAAGVEHLAHPLLLEKAALAVGIRVDQVAMWEPTKKYLNTLERLCRMSPLHALGAIGVGNELLLVTEYTAARTSYTNAYGKQDGAEFFDANIASDKYHYELCAGAASAYCRLYESDTANYLDGARRAVKARTHFYDSFVQLVRKQ